MDLDDILKRAEDHETVADAGDGGTSLGGEGFLAQFAAVSDVKNDMSWEDIIPLEERQKFEKDEDHKKAEELAAQESRDRKRNHAPVSYEGMDIDQPAPKPEAKKPKAPGPQRKTADQKAMELKERDVRVLIRSLQRWGDIRQRYDVIVSIGLSSLPRFLLRLFAGHRGQTSEQEQRHDAGCGRRYHRALRTSRRGEQCSKARPHLRWRDTY